VNLGVRFNEGEHEFRLKGVSLKLQSGKSLGLVGEVGSGKTALVEALLLFNPVCDGEILFDGVSVGSEQETGGFDPRCHRQWFSFASQRAFLFSASLRDNLLLALGDWGPDRVKSDAELFLALEMAGFFLDPGQFPQGLDTQVGEKGIMLSGGQRQRIALARCFLKDTVFYILDDVLSAVDQETQRTILENLKTRSAMSSFLIVSHRISAVQWCDEILVLEQGCIVDRGSHRELISRPGYYRASFEYQSRKDVS
jgi:ABC-type multidrug transport system fused ATPase/permease subunit